MHQMKPILVKLLKYIPVLCVFFTMIYVAGFWQDDTDHVHSKWSQHICLAEQTTACLVELVY